MGDLNLEIVTPYGRVFSGNVSSVYVPARDGEMGILPGHCSLLFLLSPGVIEINLDGGEQELVAINWGHASVDDNVVSIIADGAVSLVDHGSVISGSMERAKELLEGAMVDFGLIVSSVERLRSSKLGRTR